MHDPLGGNSIAKLTKDRMDKLLADGDSGTAGVIHTAIEEFAAVVRRLMKLERWQGSQHIVAGGGLRGSQLGEFAVGRAADLLHGDCTDMQLMPI